MKRWKVTVTVDRPIGYLDSFGTCYPLNYGYITGIIGGDGEEQDAYILSESSEKLAYFSGEVIAIVHRYDDIEDKWVVAASDAVYSQKEIVQKISFIEQYFQSTVELLE